MKHTLEAHGPECNEIIGEIDRVLDLRPSESDSRTSFKISDLAREFGVTLRTLRFYEDRGLLNPERRGTTRLYSRRDRMRLRMIQFAKTLGFSLTEAKQIIDVYHQPNGAQRQMEMSFERMKEQRQILVSQQEEIAFALKAIDSTLSLLERKIGQGRQD